MTQVQLGSGNKAARNTMAAAICTVPVVVMVDGPIKKQLFNDDLQAEYEYVTNIPYGLSANTYHII